MKYICTNPECESFNVEATVYRERITIVDGESVLTGAPCPICKKKRTPINPEGMTTYITGIDGPKK